MPNPPRLAIPLALAALALPPTAVALEPVGHDDFPLSTDLTSAQSVTGAVPTPDGGYFVLTWRQSGQFGLPGDPALAQRITSDGTPVGAAFPLHEASDGARRGASGAADASGGFVVAWEHSNDWIDPIELGDIEARRFDSIGAAIGAEFRVNTYTTGKQATPSVARLTDGAFAVVWANDAWNGNTAIVARSFTSAGAPIGDELQLSTDPLPDHRAPTVGSEPGGGAFVGWIANHPNVIQARRLGPDGSPAGPGLSLAPIGSHVWGPVSIARYAGGPYVAVWTQEPENRAQKAQNEWFTRAQLLSAEGSAVGAQFTVNDFTDGAQFRAVVTADGNDGFLVAWHSFAYSETDELAPESGVRARSFFGDGTPASREVPVNTSSRLGSNNVSTLGATLGANGNVLVFWTEHDENGPRLPMGRFLRVPDLFADSFEGGSLEHWSDVVAAER